jgi:hypothetical protein
MARQVERLLRRLDTAWTAFKEPYAGLPDAWLLARLPNPTAC